MVFAVVTASSPDDVGVSVDPNPETISEIPAASYSDRYEARSLAVNSCQF